MPGGSRIRCQVLREMHHSSPHSPKDSHAASQQNVRLRKSQNINTFSADNLGMCHREHPSCNASVTFFTFLLLPFCAPVSALGHFWAQSCPAVSSSLTIQSCWKLSWRSGIAPSIASYTALHTPLLLPTPTCPRKKIHQDLTGRRGKKHLSNS